MLGPETWCFLERVSSKYLWWKEPAEALGHPGRLIAQVMDIGTFDDLQTLVRLVGEEKLRDIVAHAEAGWFRPQSWAYWHYRLGLIRPGEDPPRQCRRDWWGECAR